MASRAWHNIIILHFWAWPGVAVVCVLGHGGFKRGGLGHGLHMMLVKQVSAIAFGWVDGVLGCFN